VQIICVVRHVQVKAILVNVFGGIVNCATIANGIVNAAKSINMSVPIVVRLEGTVMFLVYLLNNTDHVQGAPIKNNPLGKINYPSYCNRFFHQIYSFYRGGFRPHRQQISLQ